MRHPACSPSVCVHHNAAFGVCEEENVAKEDRGFASMDRSKQREIASKGGKAAHQKGTAHEWTSEEARDAGRKGGIASHRRRREQTGGPETEESRPSDFESQPTSVDQPDRPVESRLLLRAGGLRPSRSDLLRFHFSTPGSCGCVRRQPVPAAVV